jgi:WPP domain
VFEITVVTFPSVVVRSSFPVQLHTFRTTVTILFLRSRLWATKAVRETSLSDNHLERRRQLATITITGMAQQEWELSQEQRQETVQRLANNIAALLFAKDLKIKSDEAAAAAEAVERKAYTVARVEACTTTGVRPHAETLQAYTRRAELLGHMAWSLSVCLGVPRRCWVGCLSALGGVA